MDAGSLVLVYLFHDRERSNTFAYSVDVTGRNIPLDTTGSKWIFVAVTSDHDMPEDQEVMRSLRLHGYHVFER